MQRPHILFAAGVLLWLAATSAMALGFGRVSDTTVLGQALNFSVSVRLDAEDSVSAECVSAEVFVGDNKLPAPLVRVSVEALADPTERLLRVTTTRLIDEPVISVNVQVGCPPRMARKYVAFIDPPLVNLAQAAPAESGPQAEPPRGVPDAVPAAPAPGSSARGVAPRKPAPRPRRAAPAVVLAARPAAPNVAASAAPPASRQSPRPAVAAAAAPRAGARLQLEAADADPSRAKLNLRLADTLPLAAPGAAASAAAALLAATPAPVLDLDAEQRAKERERFQALENSLGRLRADSQQTQKSLAQVQTRLREAEAERFANPLVYALGALALLLAAGLGVTLWKRVQEPRESVWWTPPPATLPPADFKAETAAAALVVSTPDEIERAQAAERNDVSVPPSRPAVPASGFALTEAPLAIVESSREMSVEELIDLEQQAEFFVVLGQDEAAIELLMGHLRSSGGVSPLPYLKLLEIYRRRQDREPYERIRERFNRRFNAYAADWDSDPQQGRVLEDYPSVIAQLQSLWARPAQAMQALEASLFRRDASSATFDLPAYRELLALYSIARDLSERSTPAAEVDFLIPLGGDSQPSPLTRLHASRQQETQPAPPGLTAVDVDITGFDAGPPGSDNRPPGYNTDFGPTSGSMPFPNDRRIKPG